MPYSSRQLADGFGPGLTSLGKGLLIAYSVIYVLELILEHWINVPVVRALQLHAVKSEGFRWWQVVTAHFIHDPVGPIGFLLNCLVFYFFSAHVEFAEGTRRFLIIFFGAALGGAVFGMLFSMVSGFNAPFVGMTPSLLALVVIFGLLNPEATILLFFVIPIKAKYLSYATVLITFLTFLAKVNPHGAYHLGGIFTGYVLFRGPGQVLDPNMLYIRYHQWRFERKKRARFRVIQGYKDQRERDDTKPPTYH